MGGDMDTAPLIIFSESMVKGRSDSDFCSDLYVQITSHFEDSDPELWPSEFRYLVTVSEYSWRIADGGHSYFLTDESFALAYYSDIICGLKLISAHAYASIFDEFYTEYKRIAELVGDDRGVVVKHYAKELLSGFDARTELLNNEAHIYHRLRSYVVRSNLFELVTNSAYELELQNASDRLKNIAPAPPERVPFSANTLWKTPLGNAFLLLFTSAGIEISAKPAIIEKSESRMNLIGGRTVKLLVAVNEKHYEIEVNLSGATLALRRNNIFKPQRFLATLPAWRIPNLLENL